MGKSGPYSKILQSNMLSLLFHSLGLTLDVLAEGTASISQSLEFRTVLTRVKNFFLMSSGMGHMGNLEMGRAGWLCVLWLSLLFLLPVVIMPSF